MKTLHRLWGRMERISDVQLDSENQYSWNISEARLELVLGFPLEFLKDKSVIELGCGPGRFSEHFIKYCKDLTIVDSLMQSITIPLLNIKIALLIEKIF